MPKPLQSIDRQAASNAAAAFGDTIIDAANSFAGSVFLGEQFAYKIVSDRTRMEKGDVGKAERIVADLAAHAADIAPLLPRAAGKYDLLDGRFVAITTRLRGERPKVMTSELASDIGRFLNRLHGVFSYNSINEFDGINFVSLGAYHRTMTKKFRDKLLPYLDKQEELLVEESHAWLESHIDEVHCKDYVLVHKDLHLGNVLVDPTRGGLTAVLDWEAAQSAPAEWEYSILLQRFPECLASFRQPYNRRALDNEAIKACGLIQALRFWKSFPLDRTFVEKQKQFIHNILYGRLPL